MIVTGGIAVSAGAATADEDTGSPGGGGLAPMGQVADDIKFVENASAGEDIGKALNFTDVNQGSPGGGLRATVDGDGQADDTVAA